MKTVWFGRTMGDASMTATREALLELLAELEQALAAERAPRAAEQSRADDAVAEHDRLREAYRHLRLE